MAIKYDFSGWVTKNDIRCSDGRTIRQDAFRENDGKYVPLVWQHQHNNLENVLGKILLENRKEGVYGYGIFNETYMGKNAKQLLAHGDITSMSIFANKLVQKNGDVIHGIIREVSLVLAGANPEAVIESLSIEHSDDMEAIIFADEPISLCHADCEKDEEPKEESKEDLKEESKEESKEDPKEEKKEDSEEMKHSEKETKEMAEDKTIQQILESMNEEQKKALYYLVAKAAEKTDNVEHSEEEDNAMKHNVFEGKEMEENVLSHDAMETIINDAKRFGSLKESFLQHAEDYGITDIEYLFPDAKAMTNAPEFIKRDMGWVDVFMKKTHHTPFSRIKSLFADITEDDARAKGYIKGNMKKDEFFGLIRRVTTPTTVYKKQKLDRDDQIDIVDFDVVAWLKTEMRMMLDEEIARAGLVGDQRLSGSDDKINETSIRPIWTDNSLFTIVRNVTVDGSATEDDIARETIRNAIKARKNYKGSGNPIFFTTEDMLSDMLLLTDDTGRDLYPDEAALAKKLRVSQIATVPVMENLTREVGGVTKALLGIIVNPVDYTFGADKGGSVSMFDDFDIDYNQMKYLIETRCSGALTKPYSAIVLEKVVSA